MFYNFDSININRSNINLLGLPKMINVKLLKYIKKIHYIKTVRVLILNFIICVLCNVLNKKKQLLN